MAAARAEQILAAIKTLLTGLTTTGANIQRGQIYIHEKAALPAIALMMGADVPALEYQTGLIDWELTVIVEATTRTSERYIAMDSGIDTRLNLIRKEVYAAMLADHTLGLAFVIDVSPGTAAEPILSGEGDMPIASQVSNFVISYRTSRADISA